VNCTVTSSVWTFATHRERQEWANLWARRIALPRFSERAIQLGYIDGHQIEDIAAEWKLWAEEPDGWFAFIHGEVVASKPV
jgi:hypothetical protein